jgi:ABC-type antimicrobial peptide transport system permease subunit
MFGVMGRLPPNVTRAETEAQLTSIWVARSRRKSSEGPAAVILSPAAGFGVPVAVQEMTVKLSAFIYVLMGLLMAIACANVAALVLARSAGRSREISVRLSLGATRWQIARQLLIESFALALVGCMAGTMAALWMTQVLIARLSTPFQYVEVPVGPFR